MREKAVIGLIAPGSSVNPGAIDLCVRAIERLGFNAVVGDACVGYQDENGIRFNDAERARDLMRMFADPCVSGIMALRGGYGCGRLLNLVDYELIGRNRKPLFGYSDITALHVALAQKAGLRTYHTPMPATEFIDGMDNFSTEHLLRCLHEIKPFGAIDNPPDIPLITLRKGQCEGILVGGNLAVITSLLGTPYEIDTCGKVLFLEDIDEPYYKIDRMLLQLRLAGKFDDCAGVLFGSFTQEGNALNCNILAEIFNSYFRDRKNPVIYNLACGHCLPTVSLPLGRRVFVDADNVKIGGIE